MTDKHMSTAQGHMNDKLRNEGLPVPKEADTAEPMSAVSLEQEVRDILTAAGIVNAQTFSAGDLVLPANLLSERYRQAEQAARARERRKALEDVLSLVGQQSPALHRNDILRIVRNLANSSEPGEDA